MSRVFFDRPLECVATWWRVLRRDGVTLGFTSHDRDLWFDGVRHRAAPGMVPSAIRLTAGLELDSAEVSGALTHDAISPADLAEGRFDGAQVRIGLVDWESLECRALYRGEIGEVGEEGGRFDAELRSAKAALEVDSVPRTSPTCRAQFCGPGCTLSAARFTHEAQVVSVDAGANRVLFAGGPDWAAMRDGWIRWIDGPHAGLRMLVSQASTEGLVPDRPLEAGLAAGTRALLREGCDHTIATCASRFGNAVNFQGEPYLPGNDVIARYPTSTT